MFLKFLKLTNHQFLSFKNCLFDHCNTMIAFKEQSRGYKINLKNFLFEVIYYSGKNNLDTLRPKWYGLIIKRKCGFYIVNYIGLPVYFWLTFFAFMILSYNELDLTGVVIGMVMFITVQLLNIKEYSSLKNLANNIIQQYTNESKE